MLSGQVALKYGHEGLPKNTINIDFSGNAGQSFGAWLAKGITLNLSGDANDYVGKGLSGGIISIKKNINSKLISDQNIIAGNTLLYGAISGECYINGVVGERFAVRNSGATAIVEGCGDHGAEYMTGGVVVILGQTGRNFAAGMSGGIAYIYDKDDEFIKKCNMAMVEVDILKRANLNDDLNEELIDKNLLDFDEIRLKKIIQNHVKMTSSVKGEDILSNWDKEVSNFKKVMPTEFKRVLTSYKKDNMSKVAGE